MDERKTFEFRIGVVVIATILVLVVFIVLFGPKRLSIFSGDYTMNIIFDYAPMIQQNSPVFKNGVEIGRVRNTELIENDRSVKVVVNIKKHVHIFSDEECSIKANLMGVTSINFKKKTEKGPTLEKAERLPPNSTIYGYSPPDIVSIAGSMEQQVTTALQNFSDATKEITKSFAGLNTFIGTPEEVRIKQDRLEKTVKTAMTTMESINKLSIGLEKMVNDPDVQNNFKTTAQKVPQLLSDVNALMKEAQTVLKDVGKITGRIDRTFTNVDTNLDHLTKFTKSLGDEGPKFFEKLIETAGRLKTTMGEMEKFMAALNDPNGSVGQLLDDPEFFNGIKRTMQNVEDITLQVKPILADARVISDKIARDPGGTIGVRSLLTKSSPIKGSPSSNIGFVGGNGEFPEPQPRFQLAQLPKWWQCPQRSSVKYKYVMPGSVSTGIPAENYEYPPSAQQEFMDITPESHQSYPMLSSHEMNENIFSPDKMQVSTVGDVLPRLSPPAPTRIQPAPALGEQVFGLELEFTPASKPESSPANSQVIPLPPVEMARASNLQDQPPKFQLDFGPIR